MHKSFLLISLFTLLFTTPLLANKSNAQSLEKWSNSTTEVILASDIIPPYVYLDDNKKFTGTLVSTLRKVFIQAKISHKFKYFPWNRAISETQSQTNVLMYPVSRTTEREHKFKWILPLQTVNYRLYGIKGKFDPDNVDVRSGDYTFVCQETTILCDILSSFGIPDTSIVKRSSLEIEQLANMLLRGRIDFLIISESERQTYANMMAMETADTIPLTDYNYAVVDYLVGNKKVDTELVKKLRLVAASLKIKKEVKIEAKKSH